MKILLPLTACAAILSISSARAESWGALPNSVAYGFAEEESADRTRQPGECLIREVDVSYDGQVTMRLCGQTTILGQTKVSIQQLTSLLTASAEAKGNLSTKFYKLNRPCKDKNLKTIVELKNPSDQLIAIYNEHASSCSAQYLNKGVSAEIANAISIVRDLLKPELIHKR